MYKDVFMAQNPKDKNTTTHTHRLSTENILSHVQSDVQILPFKADQDKELQITQHFKAIMEILGLDLADPSLMKTPARVAKMYVREIFQGLNPDYFPQITVMDNTMGYDQMILVKKIHIITFCEHHFIPICGQAHIAYIPQKYIIGLSKINRMAQFFAKRPQVQERLTKQIADALCYILQAQDVAVSIDAQHHCVTARGVEDIDSTTNTSDLRGAFKNDPKTRMEFMQQSQT